MTQQHAWKPWVTGHGFRSIGRWSGLASGHARRPLAGQAEDPGIDAVPSHQVSGRGRARLVRSGKSTTLVCHANYEAMRGLVDFLVSECCADEAECKDTKTAA